MQTLSGRLRGICNSRHILPVSQGNNAASSPGEQVGRAAASLWPLFCSACCGGLECQFVCQKEAANGASRPGAAPYFSGPLPSRLLLLC